MPYDELLFFWFKELKPEQWWAKDEALDEIIRVRFGTLHTQAAAGELFMWRKQAEGALAEIILLDQFSRNIYRNDKRSFAFDGMALVLAQEAIRQELNKKLAPVERAFLYLPFMHSESKAIHEQAMLLFSEKGLEENLKFEIQHRDIINRFGRYPHRNQILNRASTEEEVMFLRDHSGF